MVSTTLLYFSQEPDGEVMKNPPHPELGAALTALKEARGMTASRLARLSGISRRHVVLALQGGNISMTVLKAIMRALQADTIDLGDLTIHGREPGIHPTMLITAAEQIERSVAMAAGVAASLRTYAQPTGASALMNVKAAALIRDFTSYVQTVTDPERLSDLQNSIEEAVRTDDPALHPTRGDRPVKKTRRRTRSA
jgi:transcriptional regulator with XRE-family HTH domain